MSYDSFPISTNIATMKNLFVGYSRKKKDKTTLESPCFSGRINKNDN